VGGVESVTLLGWVWRVRLEGLAATYSPASWDAVPLAQRVFTAEFGMGSGVLPLAVATKPPKRTCHELAAHASFKL
jgi:hypothetical protein